MMPSDWIVVAIVIALLWAAVLAPMWLLRPHRGVPGTPSPAFRADGSWMVACPDCCGNLLGRPGPGCQACLGWGSIPVVDAYGRWR